MLDPIMLRDVYCHCDVIYVLDVIDRNVAYFELNGSYFSGLGGYVKGWLEAKGMKFVKLVFSQHLIVFTRK